MISSPWGIGIIGIDNGSFATKMMAQDDQVYNGWRLDVNANRMNVVADFDKDGVDEILVSSKWGIGIMQKSGATASFIMTAPNHTVFGDWNLNTAENDFEIGNYKAKAILVYHNDWKDDAIANAAELRSRGYDVFITDNASDGLKEIKSLAGTAKKGDRCLVYLGGHGSNPRSVGDESKSVCKDHFIQVNTGSLYVSQTSPLFKKLGDLGADLTVYDGSCNGGETVYDAAGEKYCALSTTSVYEPGLTGTPALKPVMNPNEIPCSFSYWWDGSHNSSSILSGTLVRTLTHRPQQRIFMNDNNEFSRKMVFTRSAFTYLLVIGDWDMHYEWCNAYPTIFSESYKNVPEDEKSKFTVTMADYIAKV
ncbi:MAG TPA: hypothetical protein VHV83_03135, partial [Armatimonadota bacterium]|nr:hypothetical protein [Armatimonadota bacterium]